MKNFLTRKYDLHLDWILGIFIGLPLSFPQQPYYWIGFLAFLLAITRLSIPLTINKFNDLFLVMTFNTLVIIINLFSSYHGSIYAISIIATLFSMFFFLFRYCVKDVQKFMDGFLFIMSAQTILTVLLFLTLKPYENGFSFFVESDLRMWGRAYITEWPNVFCVFLVISAYLNWIKGRNFWTVLNMLAAILTTSRMALVALLFFSGFYLFSLRTSKKLGVIGLLIVIISIIYLLKDNELFSQYLTKRLFKSDDRMIIFDSLLDVFRNHKLGIGNVPFEVINDSYQSYHSTYLKVLIRYGVLGLILFMFLIKPKKIFSKLLLKENVPILFILVVSVFQDMLFHVHLIMLYSVLLTLREHKIKQLGISDKIRWTIFIKNNQVNIIN